MESAGWPKMPVDVTKSLRYRSKQRFRTTLMNSEAVITGSLLQLRKQTVPW